MNRVVIVAYGRSACCRAKKGSFANSNPVDWSAQVLNGVLDKIPQLSRDAIDDVVMGCANPIEETGKNIARNTLLRAGLPEEIPGMSLNRACSSGLQAMAICANAIEAGEADVMVAGGVEFMSHTFFVKQNPESLNRWLIENSSIYMSMGITAENVAEKYDIDRIEMDQMAVESHAKALWARDHGKLAASIVPVHIDGPDGEQVVCEDEGIRSGVSLESLAGLKPAFKDNGVVTAATSSQTTDGAAFVVLMSVDKAAELGIKPIARFVSFAVKGCDPALMGLGPIYAVPQVMKRAGLTVADMDVIELNEAFAAQAIPCIRELGLPAEKLNPYGGAIALGHPMGATGVILACKALDYLQDTHGRYGLITMCIGGGMGAAGILERL